MERFSFNHAGLEIIVCTVRDQYNDYSVVYDVAAITRINGKNYELDWTTSSDTKAGIIAAFKKLIDNGVGGPRVYDQSECKHVHWKEVCPR